MCDILVYQRRAAVIAVRVPKDIEDRLDRLAKKTGRTKTFYVREAILEHLEELEEVYLAQQVLEDLKAGKEKTVSIEDVIQKYGMED
jgi:RHH-type transcriptional regulator, rel operon repressor / antitoxin RelB